MHSQRLDENDISDKGLFQLSDRSPGKRKMGNALENSTSIFHNIEHFNANQLKISRAYQHQPKPNNENLPIIMRDAIEERNYRLVHSNLCNTSCPCDPNEEIKFDTVYMTGLEYSIYKGDWEMAILLYINSADPVYNCFDGTILKYSVSQGKYVHSHSHLAFIENRSKMCNHIAGFKGLYCLVNPRVCNYEKVMSSLWLMRRAYENEISPPSLMMKTICSTRYHIYKIGCQDIWRTHFCTMIYTYLLCLRRSFCSIGSNKPSNHVLDEKLPNDVSLHILEYLIDDVLSDVIQEVLQSIAKQAVAGTT